MQDEETRRKGLLDVDQADGQVPSVFVEQLDGVWPVLFGETGEGCRGELSRTRQPEGGRLRPKPAMRRDRLPASTSSTPADRAREVDDRVADFAARPRRASMHRSVYDEPGSDGLSAVDGCKGRDTSTAAEPAIAERLHPRVQIEMHGEGKPLREQRPELETGEPRREVDLDDSTVVGVDHPAYRDPDAKRLRALAAGKHSLDAVGDPVHDLLVAGTRARERTLTVGQHDAGGTHQGGANRARTDVNGDDRTTGW